jgi:hypothetical protein
VHRRYAGDVQVAANGTVDMMLGRQGEQLLVNYFVEKLP